MKMNKLWLLALLPFLIASNFPVVKYRALDNNGNPVAGAKLYTCPDGAACPGTALATYPTEADALAGTNANANPVVADAYGWFGEIYLKTTEAYKLVLKNSAATVTYWTVDIVNAAELISTSLATRVAQIATNPLDYGAVGDGVADEYADVQAAINAATGTVDLLGKTYKCNTGITIPSGITLKNGTLDFQNCTDARFVTVQGTLSGTEISVQANIAAGAVTFTTTSATSVNTGDWFILYSTAAYIAGGSAAEEIFQVKSIAGAASPYTITPTNPIQRAYAIANGAAIKEINDVTDVTIDDVKFLSTNSAGSTIILSFKYATDITVKDSLFNGARLESIEVDDSANVLITNTVFENVSTANGSGVDIEGATRDLVIDSCEFRTGAYGVEIPAGVPARWITIRDSFFDGVDESIYIQGYAEKVTIDGCSFVGDDASNGQISGLTTGAVINDLSITNNKFVNGTTAIKLGALYLGVAGAITIADNNIANGGITVVDDTGSPSNLNSLTITNNHLASGGITIGANSGSGVWSYVGLSDNDLSSGNTVITEIVATDIKNNNVKTGNISVYDPTTSVSIKGNTISTGSIAVADLATSTADVKSISVLNNSLGTGNVTVDGVLGSGSFERVIVSSNTFDDGEIAITGTPATVALPNVIVSNNIVTSAEANPTIDIAAVGMVSILGNNTTGAAATYGIEITDVDNALISGNTIDYADIRLLDGSTNVTSESIKVNDNHLLAGSITFVPGATTSVYDRIMISNNTLENGQLVVTESATTTMTSVNVVGNIFNTTAAKALDIEEPTSIYISGNRIVGDGATTTYGMEINDITNITITDNNISGLTATTDYCIRIPEFGALATATITGNICAGYISLEAAATDTVGQVRISNNLATLISATEGSATSFVSAIISNNTIGGPAAALPSINVVDIARVIIEGNEITGDGTNTTYGIYVDGETGVDSAIIGNNRINSTALDGIGVSTIDDVNISNNWISAVNETVSVVNSDFVSISNNRGYQTDATDECFDIQEATEITITGNSLECETQGIEIENSGSTLLKVTISGNTIDSESEGIYINNTKAPTVNTESIVISGNTIYDLQDDQETIEIAGYAYNVTISGNTLYKASDVTGNIRLYGSGAGRVNLVNIVGNVMNNGSYGIEEETDANNTNITATGNQIVGMGTADVEFVDSVRSPTMLPLGDVAVSCQVGEIYYDTGSNDEFCICLAANTWGCIDIGDETGPID